MGLFDRFERGLERTVNGVFAKAFRSEVQPVEIAAAIRRAMDDKAALTGPGRTMVPNLYDVELSTTDYQRLATYEQALGDELVAAAAEHVESQRYSPAGPLEVAFREGSGLETGVFVVRTATAKRGSAPLPPAGMPPAGMPPAGPAAQPPQARPQHGPVSVPNQQQLAPGVQGSPGMSPGAPVGPPPVGQPPIAPVRPAYPAQPLGHGQPAQQGQGQPAQQLPPHLAGGHASVGYASAERPWLDVAGDRYPLMGALTVVGRDDNADIVLDDPGISRRHTELRVTHDGPHLVTAIRDLGSTNGTFVNGERITSRHLNDGDRVTIGRTTVVFRAGKR